MFADACLCGPFSDCSLTSRPRSCGAKPSPVGRWKLPGHCRWLMLLQSACDCSRSDSSYRLSRWSLGTRWPRPLMLLLSVCVPESYARRRHVRPFAPRAGRTPNAPGPCLPYGRISSKEARTQSAPLRVPARSARPTPHACVMRRACSASSPEPATRD